MEQFETYSVRQRRLKRSGRPVTYVYNPIPDQMRAQAFHALQMAGGPQFNYRGDYHPYWGQLEKQIVREHGYFHRLPPDRHQYSNDSFERVSKYLGSVTETEFFLDVVEIGFRSAQLPVAESLGTPHNRSAEDRLKQAVDELNLRFGQHDLGYAFVGMPGLIVRVDTQYVHSEIVEPAITLLAAAGWDGPLNEFMAAHRHYRRGDNKSAMNEALKAFESTMKSILLARGWHYEENWQAKSLIKAMFDNELIPRTLESYFGGIKNFLESGVPTLRNKQSGHGQGSAVTDVPDYMAAFALHLTASNIVFLLSAHIECSATEVP